MPAPPACPLAKPPPRPSGDEAGFGGQDYSPVFAMRTIDIGAGPDAGPISLDASTPLPPFGFDLDGVNTCHCGGAPSCVQPAGTKEICDDDAGRDHIALQLFRALGPSARMGSEQANLAMQSGQFGILLKMEGYNGGQNDQQVTVSLYVSNGIVGVQDGGVVTPGHDGVDRWTVDPSYLKKTQNMTPVPAGTDCSTTQDCQPAYADPNAYVSGGKLVANMGQVPLTFGYRANIGGALMVLDSVIISGTIREVSIAGGTNIGFRIDDGSISGRWQTGQLLANMATIPDPFVDGSFFCGTDPLYPAVKNIICSLQDIDHDRSGDNTGNAPCDALSMGFAFTAEPVHLGTVYPGPTMITSGCTDEAGTPWHDQCQ